MKKIKILVFALLFSAGLFSQEVKLGEVIELLIKDAPKNFENYKGAKITNPTPDSTYKTTIKIVGANSTVIKRSMGINSFEIDFGSYDTRVDASKALNSLRIDLVSKKTGYSYVSRKDSEGNSTYRLVYKQISGAKVYNAYFKFEKIAAKFKVSFIINKKILLQDYKYLTNEPDKSPKSDEIRKIIDASTTNFDDFKGEFTNKFGIIKYYSSKFCLSGFAGCLIYPNITRRMYGWNDTRSFFTVPIAQEVTLEEAEKMVKKTSELVVNALGKDYAVIENNNGFDISYCNKKSVGEEMNEIVVIEMIQSPTTKKLKCTLSFCSL
jgi:hypothetical protein